jgi:hypothetical protein
MDELLGALSKNGYARHDSAVLDSIIANTMQDGQYSPGAFENARILQKYSAQYGRLTVAQIKALAK